MANKDASPDAHIDLKKSARRRLVGAIAMAVLAVIVLPMVMDHEPKPASQDIQIRIPSQETAAHTAQPTATGKPPTDSRIATESGLSSGESSARTQTTTPKPSPVAQAAGDTSSSNEDKSAAKADVQKPAIPAAKLAEKPAPDKATHATTAEEAHAVAVLNGSGDQWLVRLGAYQNAGNVKLLLSKVKEAGMPVYAEKFDSSKGPRTRVVAGPFSSREAADKAQARIKKLGVDGAVIAK